jgi:hypothetical protein
MHEKGNRAVTSQAPEVWYVMLRDEASAGRIVVPLKPFLRFHRRMTHQLARLEHRMCRAIPQLARRGALDRIAQSRKPRKGSSDA